MDFTNLAETGVSTIPGGSFLNGLGVTKNVVGSVSNFFSNIGSGGGNKNDGTKWIPFDAFFEGGRSFGKVPGLEDTNPNWAKSYYDGIKKDWSLFGTRNLSEWNDIFIYVLKNNPFFFKGIKGDWVTPLNNEFNRLQNTNQKLTNSMGTITVPLTKSTSFDMGQTVKDVLLGAAGSALSSIDKQLSDNENYSKVKSDVLDNAAKNTFWTVFKPILYIGLPVILLIILVKRKN